MSRIDSRLAELGLTLPTPTAPAANYVSYLRDGDLLWVSGQVPMRDGAFVTGKLGAEASLEQGVATARLCGLSLIAQAKDALDGDLDRVVQVVKLVGFVNSTPDFDQQPAVINGASDLMVEVFAEAGRHTRSAVSAASLPFGVSVEIEGVFRVS